MKIRNLSAAVIAALALGSFGAAHAAGVTITKDTSTVNAIPGLTGFVTLGDDMTGVSITATFSGGFTETLAWATTGASSGGVSGNGWSLSLTGDTFNAPWEFAFSPNADLGQLTQLVLDGRTGLTVWDTTEPSPGTPGSAAGRDFVLVSGCDSCDIDATYTNAVAVSPDAAVGDEFHVLTINFLNQSGPRTNFSFGQDADNDSRYTRNVPEPTGLALVGLALAAAGLARRRRG